MSSEYWKIVPIPFPCCTTHMHFWNVTSDLVPLWKRFLYQPEFHFSPKKSSNVISSCCFDLYITLKPCNSARSTILTKGGTSLYPLQILEEPPKSRKPLVAWLIWMGALHTEVTSLWCKAHSHNIRHARWDHDDLVTSTQILLVPTKSIASQLTLRDTQNAKPDDCF